MIHGTQSTQISQKPNLLMWDMSTLCVVDHLWSLIYAPCLVIWSLFGSLVPAMCNVHYVSKSIVFCSFIELYQKIANLNHILEHDLNLAIVIAKHAKFWNKDNLLVFNSDLYKTCFNIGNTFWCAPLYKYLYWINEKMILEK